MTDAARQAGIRFIAGKLAAGHPDQLAFGGPVLDCRLTGERPSPDSCSLDDLLLQVAGDVTFFQAGGDCGFLAAQRFSMPSSWRLEENIGRDLHAIPVPAPGTRLDNAAEMAPRMALRGLYERFA